MAVPLIVYQAPGPNCVDLVFEWSQRNLYSGIPQIDLSVFPALLAGKVDPVVFRNQLHALNMYVATNMRNVRRRWLVPFVLFPLAVVFLTLRNQSVGLLWAGISILLSSFFLFFAFAANQRKRFNAMLLGLKLQVASLNNLYAAYGLRWSVHVEDRIIAIRRSRARVLPYIHIHIESFAPQQTVYVAQAYQAGASPYYQPPVAQPVYAQQGYASPHVGGGYQSIGQPSYQQSYGNTPAAQPATAPPSGYAEDPAIFSKHTV